MSKAVSSKYAVPKKPAKPAVAKDSTTAAPKKAAPTADSTKSASTAPSASKALPKLSLKAAATTPSTTPAATPKKPPAKPTASKATKPTGSAPSSKPTTPKPTTTTAKATTGAASVPKATTSTAVPKATKSTTAKAPAKPTTSAKPTTTKTTTAKVIKPSTSSAKRPASAVVTSTVPKPQKDPHQAPSSSRPSTSAGASSSNSVPKVNTADVKPQSKAPPHTSPRHASHTSTSPRHSSHPTTTQRSPRPVSQLTPPKPAQPQRSQEVLQHTQSLPNISPDGSILPVSQGARPLTGGNRRAAAPTNRRKPTVNPVKAVAARPTSAPVRSEMTRSASASGYMNGLGMLASLVGGSDSLEFANIQLKRVGSDKPKALLVHVKGRRHVMARVCEPVCASLNKGDVFVLIDPSTRTIYEWRGALANKMEIAKGMDFAGRVKNKEFGGRADVYVLEDGKSDGARPEFWELIGGKTHIADAKIAGDDEEQDKKDHGDILYGFVEASPGKFVAKEIGRERLLKEMLQTGHVYIIDCFTELYMWVGRSVPAAERTVAAAKAQELESGTNKSKKPRPKWVSITRVIEGAEPEIFKEKFGDWPSTLPITMAAIPKGRVADAKPQEKFDVNKMYAVAKREDKSVDNGLGTVQVWRVKDHAKETIPPENYGQFFTGESYVILYTYTVKNREMYIIYFWQGKKSSINEKGSSALLTVDLDDSIGGSATQIRVVQNKEPKHFMSLFKGSIMVHKGTADAHTSNNEVALYQVRTFNVDGAFADVRALQLAEPAAKHLNSNDCFILNTATKQYIWIGSSSTKFCTVSNERLAEVAAIIKGDRAQVIVPEGSENSDFWNSLGGKSLYHITGEWKWFPRMYHCTSASGTFAVDEVLDWDQDDLDNGHLNILDTSNEVYLWMGQRANIEEEKRIAMETVLEYTNNHPQRAGRGADHKGQALMVRAFQEPVSFTCHFHGWDNSKTQLKPGAEAPVILVEDILRDLSRIYTLAELQNPPKMLDSTKLETYLSDEEFTDVFKMDKTAFYKQPLWKQEQQKKGVGLY